MRILLTLIMLLISTPSFAAITFSQGKWSTTFDCPEWFQYNSLNCDGISRGGNWYPSGDTNYGSRIISEANNPAGGGGRGARFWKGSGHDNSGSGTLGVVFPSPQPELWVRWYHRYESGFEWKIGIGAGTKELYFNNTLSGSAYIGYGWGGVYRVYNQNGTPAANQMAASHASWNNDYPGGVSDGSWVNYEIYMKMDTGGTDGILRVWRNGELVLENKAINWSSNNLSALEGWRHFSFLSNQKDPGLDRPYYVDVDDIVIYNTIPQNVDAHGNPFIGPLPPHPPRGLHIIIE